MAKQNLEFVLPVQVAWSMQQIKSNNIRKDLENLETTSEQYSFLIASLIDVIFSETSKQRTKIQGQLGLQ